MSPLSTSSHQVSSKYCIIVRALNGSNLSVLDNQPKDATSWLQFQRHSHTSTTRVCSERAARWNCRQERHVFDPLLRPKVHLASWDCFTYLAHVFHLYPILPICLFYATVLYFYLVFVTSIIVGRWYTILIIMWIYKKISVTNLLPVKKICLVKFNYITVLLPSNYICERIWAIFMIAIKLYM